jgi:myo-inositol-1(or 4)-monophosphatase
LTDLAHHSANAVDRALSLLLPDDGSGRSYKTDRDFATATDFQIEDEVRALLAELTPHIGFLGEERGHTGDPDTFWCLDPIDGTVNYSRGIPDFGVSLALIDRGRPIRGEIALPQHRQRLTAHHEQATCNGEPIHVSTCSRLTDAVVSIGDFATGADSRTKNAVRLRTVGLLADRVLRVRMFGSAATDLAWLAAGHVDAVVIHGSHPWDLAAGVVIAQAAGATITHIDGAPYSLTGTGLLAASPAVHAELLALLSTHATAS